MPRTGPRLGRPPQVDLDAICDAAEAVGLQRLTATAVAAHLGVSEGTIRHHAGSTDRLYALACARIVDRLEVEAAGETTWPAYLTVLCQRIAEMTSAHPGIESYLVHGPYLDSTLELFDRITHELRLRATDMTAETAYMLASRAVILTASTVSVRSTRYPVGVRPDDRHAGQLAWMLEAFITGAQVLVDQGRVPQYAPTSRQPWARLPDTE